MNRVRVACRRMKILAHVEKSCSSCGFSDMLVPQTPGVCTSKWRPYALLNRKPMKLLQSLADADASPLTGDNASERALQTLKPRNVLNRDPTRVELA